MQESDADGKVTFKTIFPAAYSGRWPHIHFEVYESLDAATAAQTKLRTSQLAIPQDACDAVYATAGYEQSVQNLAADVARQRHGVQRRLRQPARDRDGQRRRGLHADAQRRGLGRDGGRDAQERVELGAQSGVARLDAVGLAAA